MGCRLGGEEKGDEWRVRVEIGLAFRGEECHSWAGNEEVAGVCSRNSEGYEVIRGRQQS
jgi:hypothetical protein